MTTECFIKWIQHFSNFKPSGDVLLIFDGAKCHLHPSIIDAAEKNRIHLYCLPSNTTHELQPLDKSVFRSFETYWDEEVLTFWKRHSERKLTKDLFGKIFSAVWPRAVTPLQ